MRCIPLSKGFFALVDDEDFERCQKHNWFLVDSKTKYTVWRYAATSTWDGKHNHRIYLHRSILRVSSRLRIDHKNGNGLDNRKSNLRQVTPQQNRWNAKGMHGKTSKFIGVRKRSDCRRWQARIQGRLLGSFSSEVEAALAYNNEAQRIYKDYARLNEV